MAVHANALNLAANGIASNVTHLSLHTTNGGSTGTGELSGGSYARKVPSYGTPSNGTVALSSSVQFDGPGSEATVQFLGFWNGSTWLGSAQLSANKTIGPGDTLTITAAPITVSAS